MHQIGAFEAKNTLGTLLDWVENGEEVLITRRGKPVARLVRPDAVTVPPQAQAAAARIRRRAAELKGLPWSEWKTLRDEGRR